jgi:hypothetical protein
MEDPFDRTIREVDDFLMGRSKMHQALERVTKALDRAEVDYVLCGGLAVVERGFVRVTPDIDLLVTAEGLQRFKERWLGQGFDEKSPGSRSVRDVETGVSIDFLIAGDYPGDGRPKPVRFPDPASIPKEPGKVPILDLRTLIELELASGMSAPDRMRDLADVIELIRINGLSGEYASRLDPSVQEKYSELWRAAQTSRDL